MKIFNVISISIDAADHDYSVTWLDKQILKQFATIDKAIEYLDSGDYKKYDHHEYCIEVKEIDWTNT